MPLIDYRIRDSYKGNPRRPVDVPATSKELDAFARDGFLLRPQLCPPALQDRLRAAVAKVLASEGHAEGGGDVFLRNLMDKHPAFLDLLHFPTLPVAQAMLGPQVQVLPVTARVSYPGQTQQFTTWHLHQRVIPAPYPPFFSPPQVIDSLLYLDDADDQNGPLCVVPGSHLRLHEDLPADEADLPGQIILKPKAGDVVMIHGNLWHRALPTGSQGTIRRLLILPYCAVWTSFGPRHPDGLTSQLLQEADPETKELFGQWSFL